MKPLKSILLGILTAASLLMAILMLLAAYSDRVNPESYPLIGCAGMVFPLFIFANLLFIPIWIAVKWHRLWIPLTAIVLAYAPIRTYFPINFQTADSVSDSCLRIVSYNVCGFGGNWKYDHAVDTIASYLRKTDADIVCLQEDHGGKGGSGFDKMKELYAYNDTVHLNNTTTYNAMGIHTRFPIIRRERIAYESACNGSMAYYLQVGTDTLIVINNHLESTHLSENERKRYKEVLKGEVEQDEAEAEVKTIIGKLIDGMTIRAAQAQTVADYIKTHSQYPIILCGDFNDTPISYARHTISENLTDCFVAAGCGLGLSYNRKGFNFRIDHVMCSSDFEPAYCFIDSEMDASDHYPVILGLKMAPNP